MILHIRAVEAKDLPKMDVVGKADPYLLFQIKGITEQWRTKDIKQTFDPTWNEEFHIPIEDVEGAVLHIELYDWDKVSSDDLISTRDFDIKNWELGKIYEDWYEFFAAPKVEKPGKVHLFFHLAKEGDPPFIQLTKELPKREAPIPEVGLDVEPLGIRSFPEKTDQTTQSSESNQTEFQERGIKTTYEEEKLPDNDFGRLEERDVQTVQSEVPSNQEEVKQEKSEVPVREIQEDRPALPVMGIRETEERGMPQERSIEPNEEQIKQPTIEEEHKPVQEKSTESVQISKSTAQSQDVQGNINPKLLLIIIAIIVVEILILKEMK